ncbi:hypothetical protein BO71DRAFT_398827 [Aspergillus ellipticus CBS 707.79]|uniref:Uncharacterized protein n=1 Tax=Aspergillus ellipticus CBS 707.79 TaxID=1448320 RepID=A0A319E1U1_9EURO|nr:hypothetical protein BO71DRAFT_398827 [Aspergillus ellipticus CBS 707.79]
MLPPLLKPLAVFATDSHSQRYIKTVRNIGDAWRKLTDEPSPESKTTIIETTFDVTIKLSYDPSSDELSVLFELQSTKAPTTNPEPVRHYRIFPDYGTDFIWLNQDDPFYALDSTYIESSDALSFFPPAVLENYDAWVDTHTLIGLTNDARRHRTTMRLFSSLWQRRSVRMLRGLCWRGGL